MALSPHQIAARCVEISKGLCALPSEEVVFPQQDLAVTRDVGVLARTAAILQGQQAVKSPMLPHIANQVGVQFPELVGTVLPSLEALSWGEVVRDGHRVASFVERVPPTDIVLRTLGESWDHRDPTEYDRGSVRGLHMLSTQPIAREAFTSELSLAEPVAKDVIEYGMAGTYIDESNRVLWSPLYWHAKEEEIRRVLGSATPGGFDDLGKASALLQKHAGLPEDQLESTPGVLNGAIVGGFFPTVKVRTPKSQFVYFFPPHTQFSGEPKSDLFEKGRTIVGALRHGQYHADVTRIRSPLRVLRRLVDGSMDPHSHAIYQYAPLKVCGLADIEPVEVDGSTRYKVTFIDTPENRQATQLAEILLRAGTSGATDITDPELLTLFGKGIIAGSAKQRIERRQKRVAATDELEHLRRALRGVRY